MICLVASFDHGANPAAARIWELEVRDFQPISSCLGLGGFRFPAPIPPKILEPGETKAGNGCSTLKTGGYHVVGPWDPLSSTWRSPGRVLTCKWVHGPWSVAPSARAKVAEGGFGWICSRDARADTMKRIRAHGEHHKTILQKLD